MGSGPVSDKPTYQDLATIGSFPRLCANARVVFQAASFRQLLTHFEDSSKLKRMLSQPPKSGTVIGAVLYGLIAGISVVVLIILGSAVLGILAALFLGVIESRWVYVNDEARPWLPIIFGEYSIIPAFVVGALVCWGIWKSRLGSPE